MGGLSLAQLVATLALLVAGLAGTLTALDSRDADSAFLDRQLSHRDSCCYGGGGQSGGGWPGFGRTWFWSPQPFPGLYCDLAALGSVPPPPPPPAITPAAPADTAKPNTNAIVTSFDLSGNPCPCGEAEAREACIIALRLSRSSSSALASVL
jgi:hypothetical protein